MSISHIQFPEMLISSIEIESNMAKINVSHAFIVKMMEGAEEDTRWYGSGQFIVNDLIEQPGRLPACPLVLSDADLRDNQMTYRGSSSIPFRYEGLVGLTLRLMDSSEKLVFIGESMSFQRIGQEKYIEHIKPG
ncbi:MAG: hypothetical protein ACI845_001597 [Gammaproteobacteria bacterium]|jgi:hypothetical protein